MSRAKSAIGQSASITARLGQRSVVLVGLMGAGKTTVGRRLAAALGLPFLDADVEIEDAAGMTIPEVFERHGEEHFRDGERRVIARLLQDGSSVLSTGGGAFMDSETRSRLADASVTVWLRAELDLLVSRTSRRNNRPLLRDDPRGTLARLIEKRHPTYGLADVIVDSRDVPHDVMVRDILDRLTVFFADPERP